MFDLFKVWLWSLKSYNEIRLKERHGKWKWLFRFGLCVGNARFLSRKQTGMYGILTRPRPLAGSLSPVYVMDDRKEFACHAARSEFELLAPSGDLLMTRSATKWPGVIWYHWPDKPDVLIYLAFQVRSIIHLPSFKRKRAPRYENFCQSIFAQETFWKFHRF